MKKICIALLVLVTSFSLVCCTQKTTAIRPLEGPQDFDHPYVVEPYTLLKASNEKHNFSLIFGKGIGSRIDSASNIEFNFFITYDDGTNDQTMRVSISAYGDIVQRGFKIEFNPRIEEDAVTDAILCAILAVGDMSYAEAEQMYSEMLEGYSGDGDSSVIRVNGYRLYVREEKPGHVLHVISEDFK